MRELSISGSNSDYRELRYCILFTLFSTLYSIQYILLQNKCLYTRSLVNKYNAKHTQGDSTTYQGCAVLKVLDAAAVTDVAPNAIIKSSVAFSKLLQLCFGRGCCGCGCCCSGYCISNPLEPESPQEAVNFVFQCRHLHARNFTPDGPIFFFFFLKRRRFKLPPQQF